MNENRSTKDSDSDSEGRYSKENRQYLSKPVKFVSSRKRKHETEENSDESIFTSTECADKKVHQLKEMGNGLKMMRKMGYKEGRGLGPNGQGMVNPIEVNMRPRLLGLGYKNYKKKANVTTLQETSDENKALSLPSGKRKNGQGVNGLEVIVSALDQLNDESHSGNLSLELLRDSFRYLKKRYPDEYKLCDLSTIACSFALPLFSRLLKGWDPLVKPEDHIDVISVWKDLLQGDEINSPYAKLFREVVLRAVRRSSANSWQVTDPEPLLHFLDIWERLTPHAALQKILDQIVMPKLLAAVNSWDPHTDTIPMHIWVHPWLPLVDPKHTTLYHTVQTKLESFLNEWHPSDESAYDILSPWKPVFDQDSWKNIMVRCITPKLLAVMQEFQVNLADQKLDQFYWVRIWANLIPIHHMLQIMDVFFNKWLVVLYNWLCLKPDLQEVRNCHDEPAAAQGLEVVPPGLRAKISNEKAREKKQSASDAQQMEDIQAETG